MTYQGPITPHIVLQNFPFPIAFDFQELQIALERNREWRAKAYRLRDLFATTLRFISIVALGEVMQRKNVREDIEIKISLQRLLASPSSDDYLQILKLCMRTFRNSIAELVIPELYSFCFSPEGQETVNMQILGRITAYQDEFTDLGTGGEDDEYKELYQRYGENNYKGPLWDLLNALGFLTNYQLLRLIDSREKDDNFLWKVKILKGIAIDPPIDVWEREAPLREGMLAFWDPRKYNILYLPPYAILYECDICRAEGLIPAENVFLYERWDQDEAMYVGIRNSSLGLAHHIHTKDRQYVEPLMEILRDKVEIRRDKNSTTIVLEQPKIQPPALDPTPRLDWKTAVSITQDRSEGQIAQFQKIKKYDPKLYLNRISLEEQFQSFISSPSIGFLVVGDAGTGKTNLLCHLSKTLVESKRDITLLYNSADFPDDLNVAKEIARSLGDEVGTGVSPIDNLRQILNLLENSRPHNGQFVILFDAINEYRKPKELIVSVNDFVTLVRCPWLKVVISCRSESWKILSRIFKVEHQFYASIDGSKENIIHRFSDAELPEAYALYMRERTLLTPFEKLSRQVKKFIADPLRMSFVADSYEGKDVPPDLRSQLVLQKYKKAKIGDTNDTTLNDMEETLVSRLIDVMFEKKVDQLRIKELWDDPVIGNWIRNRDIDSPYMRLLENGVLQETGPRSNFQQQLSKVKFTYERFFEYLLAIKVYPEKPSTAQIIDLVEQATMYPSLWGAIKIALIMNAEENSLNSKGVVAKLCREDRFDIRGMMIDTLVTYSSEKPHDVDKFCQWLLSTNNDAAGTIAIMTAYNVGSKDILLSAIRHRISSIRQTGAQFVYFFWHRDREQGNQLLQDFVNGISQDLKWALLGEIPNMALGKELDLQSIPAVQSFTEMSIYLAAHLMRNPGALSQAARLWSHLLANVPGGERGRVILAQKMREQGAKVFIEGYKAGGVMSYKTMSEFFKLPLDHRQRQLIREYTQYLKISKRQEIPAIENILFEMAGIPSAVLSTVCGGIIMNYLMSKKDSALAFVERLIGKGENYDFRRFMGLTGLAYGTVMMPDPPQSYLALLRNTVFNTWNNPSAKISLAGQDYSGYNVIVLYPAIAAICRSNPIELQKFVNELCESALHLPEKERYDLIIGQLAEASGLLEPAEMGPIFDILAEGFDVKEYLDPLAKAFADLWRKQSDRVDSILSDPDIPTSLVVATREKIERLKENQSYFGFGISSLTSLMFVEPVQDNIINALSSISANATDTDTGLGSVGSAVFDPLTIKAVADWLPQGN